MLLLENVSSIGFMVIVTCYTVRVGAASAGADGLDIIFCVAKHKRGATGAGKEVGMILPTIWLGARLYCL
jgi:hypothetical protein